MEKEEGVTVALFVRPLTSQEEKIVHELLDRYHDDETITKRLNIILLSSQRFKSGEIRRRLDITSPTVVHWIRRFNQLGVDCFESIKTW